MDIYTKSIQIPAITWLIVKWQSLLGVTHHIHYHHCYAQRMLMLIQFLFPHYPRCRSRARHLRCHPKHLKCSISWMILQSLLRKKRQCWILFKFALESNVPSNLIRTPILKAIFGWKRCALYSRKYGNFSWERDYTFRYIVLSMICNLVNRVNMRLNRQYYECYIVLLLTICEPLEM